MPLNTTSSIVDLLRSRSLPTDLGFRSQLYESLGLGTRDQFLSGARTTGATNVQLLQRLSQNPSLIDTISGAVRAGTGLQGLRLPQAGGGASPAPGQGQGQNVQQAAPQGLTLPSTVEGINAMQAGQAPSRNLTIAEQLMGRYEGSQQNIQQILSQLGGMNRTADDVFREVSDVRTKLGIPALEEEYAKLSQSISDAERDVRSEVATSGGIVTDSQARSLALERQSKILPQLERISTDLATKSTLASQIQQQLQVSRQEASQRATALLSFYQGDAQQAFSAAMDFYKLDADEAKAKLAAEREDKRALLELSLKYPTAGIDLSEDGLDGAYAKAARVAADYEDLNRLSAELDLKLKAKELAKPYYAPGSDGGLGGLTSTQANIAFKLADDYDKNSKQYFDVLGAYNRIQASSQNASAAGDLSLIFNYMKMLDPGSVVREGEFATAATAGSIPERIWGQYNKVMSGKRLSSNVRSDFVNRAGQIFQRYQSQQDILNSQYSDRAMQFGIPDFLVVRTSTNLGSPQNLDLEYRQYQELIGSGGQSGQTTAQQAERPRFSLNPLNLFR